MPAHVTVRSAGGFSVEATNGRHTTTMDLAPEDGGTGAAGMGSKETVLAALGGCTAMTLLLYAKRKGWPLEGVEAVLDHVPAPVGGGDTPERVTVALTLHGPLDGEQRARLLEIAGKCPVYRLLTRPVVVEERLAS
jgi:putative redox protein